jgi:hypothetical protein
MSVDNARAIMECDLCGCSAVGCGGKNVGVQICFIVYPCCIGYAGGGVGRCGRWKFHVASPHISTPGRVARWRCREMRALGIPYRISSHLHPGERW